MNDHFPPDDRAEMYDTLLIDRALFGLDEQAEVELDKLSRELGQRQAGESYDDTYELCAAAFDLAVFREESENLPNQLRMRIVADAEKYLPVSTSELTAHHPPTSITGGAEDEVRPSTQRTNAFRRRDWIGLIVIAACIAFILFGILPSREQPVNVADYSVQKRYENLLSSGAEDLKQIPWQRTQDNTDPGGKVVWCDSLQEGFMLIEGLPKNDPTVEQYQLWIFDRERDERYPVDGGVFDIESDGSSLIPIRAKLGVSEATMFAITIERTGGVVVSSRERLPLLAIVK